MNSIKNQLSSITSITLRLAATLLFFVAVKSASAAGLSTTVVHASGQDGAIEVLVWSPCSSPASDVRMGPFALQVTKDCAVAGRALPLVVISHGFGGTRFGHYDTATALADAGFVVASFNHPGDSFGDDSAGNKLSIFESRPAHVSRVITHMLEQWKDRQLLDAQSVGVFGFSRGGYTALALAGAVPSTTASARRFCSSWRSSVNPFCRQLDGGAAALKPLADPRVKSVVVVDALNLFGAEGMKSVKVPVQLWAAELGGDGVELAHGEQIRDWLPQTTEFTVAIGAGHFAYLAPCSEALRKEARRICEDPPGFDRVQWHATMNRAVSAFFARTLRSGAK